MNKLIIKAFTLIELLVVIAIIGILSGLIIVGMGSMNQRAIIAKSQIFSASLRDSLLMNLLSEWKFDELSTAVELTTIADSWDRNNSGTLYTGVDGLEKLKTGSDCVSGKCLSFDGSDDYIQTSSFAFTGTVLTIDVWLKVTKKATTGSTIIADAAQSGTVGFLYSYRGNNNDQLVWQYADGAAVGVASSGAFFTGYDSAWVLATIVSDYGNKTISFYRNGALLNTVAMSGTPVFPSANRVKYIGRYSSSHSYAYLGLIDDLRIYNAAIPASQIRQGYYAGIAGLLAKGEIDREAYEKSISGLII